MNHFLTSRLLASLIIPALAMPALTATETDQQAMDRIIAASGIVADFIGSSTRTVTLQVGNTDAIADANSAAINAAIAQSGAGTIVKLPAGSYYVSNVIQIKKSHLSLQGTLDSKGQPITNLLFKKALCQLYPTIDRLTWHGSGGVITMGPKAQEGKSTYTNINVSNLAISFSERGSFKLNDGYNAIFIKCVDHALVKNVKITNFEIGVSTAYATDTLIDGLTLDAVHSGHFGVGIFFATRTKVNNVTSLTKIKHDLSVQDCTNNVFQNCTLRGSDSNGIDYRGGKTLGAINYNVFKNIVVDDDPFFDNDAYRGTQYAYNLITFGTTYYSNVKRRSAGSYVPFDHLSGLALTNLGNYTHFINSSTPPPNVAPVVSAGVDKSALLSSSSVSVALTGSVSDADGDATTKQWSKLSGPVAAVTFSAPTTVATNATFTATGIYVLRLTANDGHGHIVTDDVQVSILQVLPPVNVAPVVSAGSNTSAALSASNSVVVSLTGSVTDANNDVTTKLWTKVSGPSTAVTLSAANQAITNATFTAVGTYVLRLTANDGHGHTVSSDISVVITPYAPFVRRINLNGSASTIGGNAWAAYSTALSQGLSIVPAPKLASSAFTPSPAVDTNTKAMLNSAIWNSTSFTVNQTLPKGNYSVTLWVMENYYETKLRSFNVSMEGKPIGTGLGSGLALGAWKKYTYSITVTDGQLNIGFTPVIYEPGIMGLEIVAISSVAALDFEHILGSWITR